MTGRATITYLLTRDVKVSHFTKFLKFRSQLSDLDIIVDVLDVSSKLWLLLLWGGIRLLRSVSVVGATDGGPFVLRVVALGVLRGWCRWCVRRDSIGDRSSWCCGNGSCGLLLN